jgi:hypothetical protein
MASVVIKKLPPGSVKIVRTPYIPGLYVWSQHPSSKSVQIRALSKECVIVQLDHQNGMHSLSFGNKMHNWLFRSPHFQHGDKWAIQTIETKLSEEGKYSVQVMFVSLEKKGDK